MNADAVEAVQRRSGGHCEAMLQLESGRWARCGKRPVQIHHMLKRSRGGEILDDWMIDHLVVLCQTHHMWAEESGEETGLLIDGYVGLDPHTKVPVYEGSSVFLADKIEEAVRLWKEMA